MKRILILYVIICVSVACGFVSASYAEEKQEKTSFWKKIEAKLQSITPDRNKGVTTAVGGVRGSKDDSASTLYWKGEESAMTVHMEELEKFTAALELATEGKIDESKKLFEEFLTLYPQSLLREDALAALDELGKQRLRQLF
ncbi:MAG: hypothetical protein ACMUJM_05775 [bacterium]